MKISSSPAGRVEQLALVEWVRALEEEDSLAAYLYLLTEYHPSMIILAGDSAGAGMIVRSDYLLIRTNPG